MHLEDLAVLLIWLVIVVVQVNFAATCFVLYRRFKRKRFFLVKDSARSRYRGPVEEFATGQLPLEEVLSLLNNPKTKGEREALIELVENNFRNRNADSFSDLMFVLGFVEEWTQEAFGKRMGSELIKFSVSGERSSTSPNGRSAILGYFRHTKGIAIPRAIALQQLAKLSPKYALPMLAASLQDDVLEVRLAGIWGLGRLRNREAYKLLFNELDKSLDKVEEVSTQFVLSCFGRMDFDDLDSIIPRVRDGLPKTRLALVDFAGQICQRRDRSRRISRNDFSKEFYELFLMELPNDQVPEVRAGAARVIKYFRDTQSMEALSKLIKDQDPVVQASALSCCDEPVYLNLLPLISSGIASPDSRVRKRAILSAAELGQSGLNILVEHLNETSNEQIVDEIVEGIQKGGQMTAILQEAVKDREGDSPANQALRRIAEFGRIDFLTYALVSFVEPDLKLRLLDALAQSSDPRVDEAVSLVAQTTDGPVQKRAEMLLADRV